MAIFTGAAIAAFFAVEAGFFTTAAAFALNAVVGLAASLGLSYAAKAVAGNQNQPASATDHFGVQGTLQAGGDVPRSFNLGYSTTAGSLVYANTYGGDTTTPNAYLAQVIALSDLPGGTLEEIWVNGEKVTLDLGTLQDVGYPVIEYRKDGADHLYIKYYDGTQTVADPHLVSEVSSTDHPYESTRIGKGIAYVICTSLVEDTLFTGFPTFKFALSGIPLYDPSKDSTNGGSGSHRYSDPATWGGDGDGLPAVQIYNLLRGFYYGGTWIYGVQGMSAARLPSANWITQIAKCRDTIVGEDGTEPTYRSGGQINVNAQSANAIEAILTSCQGRLSEIGGFYKLHLGAPDSPTFSWTDDDILSSEEQTYRPFFALSDSVNGIQATYPDPAQGWNTATAPAYYRPDLEVKDGNRRLMANPAFDFVPYRAQVQRLQKSAIEEAQRARTHTIVLPPEYWIVEPGDVGEWTSARNGYVDKLFRADALVDKANLDVIASLTEIDPSDYDWDHDAEFVPTVAGPTVIERPAPQGVLDWFAEPWTLLDANGIGRRPAIRLSWDGSQPGVVGIQYEVRLAADHSDVTKGRTDQLAAEAIIVSQNLIPNTAYQVRGQYLPSSPRDMLWSDWLAVTTPNVLLDIADVGPAIVYNIATLQDQFALEIDDIKQRFATLTSKLGAQQWTDTKSVRSQLASRSAAAFASIDEVQTVSSAADAALASDIETLTAAVGDNAAEIVINSTAIATLDGYAAASYSVTLDVNGYASGFELLNGGGGFSTFTVNASKIQFVHPSVNGGAPLPFLTLGTIGGVPAMGMTGNFFLDGNLTARMVATNTLTAAQILAGTLTSASGVFGALGVDSLSLADNAVTVPYVASVASFLGTGVGATIFSTTLSINTAGLNGKLIPVYVCAEAALSFTAVNQSWDANLFLNGSQAGDMSGTNGSFYIVTGAIYITGTGGTVNVPISQNWNCSNQGQIVSATIYAQAGKR